MNEIVRKRLALLRRAMAENGIDTFLLTKLDPHQSEYARDHWNYVKYFSGFAGSAGTVVVTADKAAFWTDGRYALQSREDLKDTEYLTFCSSVPSDTTLENFIKENTRQGGTFSFDERTLSVKRAEELIALAAGNGVSFKSGVDTITKAIDEPPIPVKSDIFVYGLEYAGVSRAEKIRRIRKEMEKKGAGLYIISGLEDIAWALNLRSRTESSLVFESYMAVSPKNCVLFAKEEVRNAVKDELLGDGVEVRAYEAVNDYIKENAANSGKVMIAPAKTGYALYELIKDCDIINLDSDITTDFKGVKNDVEIQKYKEVCLIDSAGIIRFVKWVKEAAKSESYTEYQAAEQLQAFRCRSERLVKRDVINNTSYGANAAFNHYKPKKDGSAVIKASGMLLIDVVGHYLGATTDITRTMVLGDITDEMRRNFTLVLKCYIALDTLKFLAGMDGHYIDIVARRPLWDHMLDFKHGTGHGIGAALGVHEGPHSIGPRKNLTPIIPGMLVSNEPGFYKDGEYGIRHENVILCKESGESPYGKFYCFEPMNFVPFDLAGIDKSLLTEAELNWLNDYHKQVYEKVSPLLDEDENAWLKEATRSI